MAGCSDLGGTGQQLTHGDLVSDLAAQLSRSAGLTYSASYRLAGGATATIVQAQRPTRSAYLYPGGKITVTAEATTECRTNAKPSTCTVNPPPTSATRPPVTVADGVGRQGMVLPDAVLALLSAAALDNDAAVTQHDTTIAGRHATCVQVENVDGAEASRFDACVTSEGVLGSFTGTVSGEPVDVAMTSFQETIDGAAFDPPTTAKLIDRR